MSQQKKILVICPHPENRVPGQRLKYEQYFSHWRAHGFEVDIEPFFSNRMQDILYQKGNILEKFFWVTVGYLKRIKLLFSVKNYDLLYVFLWVTPFGMPLMERLYARANRNFVYDIDDAIFLKSESLINRGANLIKGRTKPFFLMKKAMHVIACTPYLSEKAIQFNPNVTDISSTINTVAYQPTNNYQNDHRLVLGWSGSHSTAPFLLLLKDVLLALRKEVDFSLVVMGDDRFDIEGLDVTAIAWSEEAEIPTLQRFDIGLYPLPLDDEWVLGKSGLKALQYMAVGVPVVATAVGANHRIMINGETGLLVVTPNEWLAALKSLIYNSSLRKKLGEAGRENVVKNYSVTATAPLYLNILQQCAR